MATVQTGMGSCRHCGTYVRFETNGQCPACRRDSRSDPGPEAAARIEANRVALQRREAGSGGDAQPEGSYLLGVALGRIFGLWGVIGTALAAKAETKRGARHAFVGRLVLVVLLFCASAFRG